MQPLAGLLVVDLTRYLPGAYAARELRRLGARVVRVEAPDGDPLRTAAPAWHAALAAGTESVVCDLRADASFGRALCAGADVVLEGYRPGVAERLGVGPGDVPERVVYCSITGFGDAGPHAERVGHDLNYLGYAGALEDTGAVLPPLPVADLAAGALGAVTQILAALLERERTGRGARITVSMTHRAHDLVEHRLGGDPWPRMLTGGLACYGIYTCADARLLTLAALEPRFFTRFCELAGRPDLAERQFAEDQAALAADLAGVVATRTMAEWLELSAGEPVCIGPVSTRAEAAAAFGEGTTATLEAPVLGANTEAWRAILG
jgi:crotonobetainyl-CoA:carnitine CoA-transferase CaiB-like acyl-CoA transferase